MNLSPYTTPRSEIQTDALEQSAVPWVFALSGRIGRLHYLGCLAALLTLWSAAVAVSVVTTLSLPPRIGTLLMLGVALIANLLLFVASCVLAMRRIHDCTGSGWLVLLLLVPGVNLVFAIALCLIQGTAGNNRYAAKPAPKGSGVIVVAVLLPVVAALLNGVIVVFAVPTFQCVASVNQTVRIRH